MRAIEFWYKIVKDKASFLDEFFALLNQHAISYCIIGGQVVNA